MLTKETAQKVIDHALSRGADFAEIFVENTFSSSLSFYDNKLKESISGKDAGAGIRVFYGFTAIYAITNDLSEEGLLMAADAACKAGSSEEKVQVVDLTSKTYQNIHRYYDYPASVDKQEKLSFIRKINQAARATSELVSQVSISLSERQQKVLIANSEGVWASDERLYTRIAASAVASSGTEKQTGQVSPGNLSGYEFIRTLNPYELGETAARQAITMLKADYAPSGKLPVIIDNGFGGVIFHEACGHSLETTSVAKNASVFCGKLGQAIASPVVTAIDDGTIPNKWGSENIDDEGALTQKTILIENGILKSYMADKLGAKKMNIAPTGSGRRQNYRFAPTSRMRNTYIACGPYKLQDLITSVEYGLYAKKMGGGSVVPGTGDFNFSVAEGYLIKNGKIAEPVRGATLIGNGAKTLFKISMVADNLDHAEGMCGSLSGSVPTCVGQPAIKVDEIIVGGRKEK